ANYAVGYNNIDVNEAKNRGIIVTNTPGVSALAVAEHTVALTLALTTRLAEGDEFMRTGKYRGWEPMLLIGSDLSGRMMGLIGVGAIGSEVARIMKSGFNADIVYYDVNPNPGVEQKYGARRMATVDEVLRAADIVSLHVPLLESTHHLIDAKRLAMMKPTAFLINTSRGPVVDENALVAALKTKQIAGAGLDVYEFEPKLNKGLTKLPNVVLTPHIASSRESVRNAMAVLAAQNIIDFFETGAPKNKVS
ncbi:MAG: D-glycerate dehydrogenase, partial [Patescibacteria group bacterium]|nr:D-glycerate dehydrogenase [Patescibacteria group bacterium]